MPQDLQKQHIPIWFRTGLMVLAIFGGVFAGYVLLNGRARNAFLFQAYKFFGLVAQSDDIGWFDIDCTDLSSEAIGKKWNNANLQRVALKGATVDDRFFANLRRHEELRKLKFESCKLTNGGLGGLLQVGDLSWLEFDRCSIDAESLASINKMRNLFKVSMTDCSLTDQHLQSLYGSKIAISLTLIEDKITTGGILALRQANPSWKIELPGRQPVNKTTALTASHHVIPSIDEISKVEELRFSGMHISDVAMSIVKDASNLKLISLEDNSVTDDGLQSLRGLANLETLHLSAVNVSGPGFQFVPINVKELRLYSDMDVAWNHLDRLVQLENLEIVETHVSEDDLRAIQGLKHLKKLTVESKNSQWDGLQHLPMSINNLSLFYGVTNDNVRQLGRLNSLNTLAVEGKLISDEACNDLANMKSLRSFELLNTAITETGIQVLTKAFGELSEHSTQDFIHTPKEY